MLKNNYPSFIKLLNNNNYFQKKYCLNNNYEKKISFNLFKFIGFRKK